ncbi:hypothetical protein [Desulfocastanea catecholica]
MQSFHKCVFLLMAVLFLHGCAVYVAYGLYRTVMDINQTLTLVDNSLIRIQGVLNEGKNLRRAAEDGKLISTLAEKIPSHIQDEVELVTKEKIATLSGALKLSSLDFTESAQEEDLPGATKAFNDMSATYNDFTDLMNELSDTAVTP